MVHRWLLCHDIVWSPLVLIRLNLVGRDQNCAGWLAILVYSLNLRHLRLLVDSLLSGWLLHVSHGLHAGWLRLDRHELLWPDLHVVRLLLDRLHARELVNLREE